MKSLRPLYFAIGMSFATLWITELNFASLE